MLVDIRSIHPPLPVLLRGFQDLLRSAGTHSFSSVSWVFLTVSSLGRIPGRILTRCLNNVSCTPRSFPDNWTSSSISKGELSCPAEKTLIDSLHSLSCSFNPYMEFVMVAEDKKSFALQLSSLLTTMDQWRGHNITAAAPLQSVDLTLYSSLIENQTLSYFRLHLRQNKSKTKDVFLSMWINCRALVCSQTGKQFELLSFGLIKLKIAYWLVHP